MSKDQNIVIIAAYQAVEPASKNFDALVQLVKDKTIKTDGMILVQKDADGNVTVSETGDHLGRKGAGWGGGVGFLVGLAAPPLLASVVVGAAAGALVGKFAKHKVESGIESGLGDEAQAGHGCHPGCRSRRGSSGGGTGHGRFAGQVGRRGGRRSQGSPGRGRRQVQSRPHCVAHPRPHLRRRGRAHAARLSGGLDDDPRTESAGGGARMSCSSSSTMPALAAPTPSAVRSARPHSTVCRRWD